MSLYKGEVIAGLDFRRQKFAFLRPHLAHLHVDLPTQATSKQIQTSTSTPNTSMARKSNTAPVTTTSDTLQPHTLVLDNGAHTLKAGFATSTDASPDPEKDCHIIANCIARSKRDRRTYVGSELLDECWDFGELAFRRPVEKGFVVNWEGEKAIWERSLLVKGGKIGVRSLIHLEDHVHDFDLAKPPIYCTDRCDSVTLMRRIWY